MIGQTRELEEIHNNNAEHGKLMHEQIFGSTRAPFTPNWDQCISRTRGGKLLGGITYERFYERSICIHVAKFHPRWLSRDLLWAAFDYPFNALKVEKIFAVVASVRYETLAFDYKVGFRYETTLKDAIPGGDMVVLSMYREDCRWLGIKPRHIERRS